MSILLRGITWNHTRGYLPMIATSQRYSELHPEVTIQWEKRSLQEFADAPIQSLVGRYDLLVIDHPWAGYAAQSRALLAVKRASARGLFAGSSGSFRRAVPRQLPV
ncbi:hypothetical protein LJK87_20405 [Paenibacillus sp. P25]|nr:hypothetical protein LJK87_20405 [Paenibacillus sp. P25]